MERFMEHFIHDETEAQRELDMMHEEYASVGMYPCAGGFVVWAETASDRGL